MSILGRWANEDGDFVAEIAPPKHGEPWTIATGSGELMVKAATWSTGAESAPIRMCKLLDNTSRSLTMDEVNFETLKVVRAEDTMETEYEFAYAYNAQHMLTVTPRGGVAVTYPLVGA